MKSSWNKRITCNYKTLEALAHGGAILGGGGGGFLDEGLELVGLALEKGEPKIIPVSQLEQDDYVVTVASVGSPGAKHRFLEPTDFVKTVQKIKEELSHPLNGMITNEMGPRASINGLFQSAILGLPVVDAPANGRAHPFGIMGSLGLHKLPDYISIQAACGGDPDSGRHIELLVRGQMSKCDVLVREASIQAGGVVAVARNPVHASWLRDHAALGAMNFSINLGHTYLKALRSEDLGPLDQVARYLNGELTAKGKVTSLEFFTKQGLDIGRMTLDTGHELTFCNEYITLEINNQRLFTFPDLITTFDASNNSPVNSANVKKGMELIILTTNRNNLILGDGMKDPDLFTVLEEIVGSPILEYIFNTDNQTKR
jgi:hypothetical protein